MSKYIIEFLGTFFLVLTVALTGNPVAIGAVLVAMVYMGGYISGAHYNPAVTLAILVRGKIKTDEAFKYFLFQTLGALSAAFIFYLMTKRFFVPSPNSSYDLLAVLITEFLFTFALAFVVLHAATSEKTKGNQYYGLAIGFTLMFGAFAGGNISGGVYNPAVALGPVLFDFNNFSAHLPNLIIYLLGPFSGGLAAGMMYKLTSK